MFGFHLFLASTAVGHALAASARGASAVPLADAVVDAVPACVSVVGRSLRYEYVNETYREWFGLEPSAVTGRLVRDVVGDQAFEVLLPHIEAALAGKPQRFEATVPFRHGGMRRVLADYTPQSDADGNVVGFIALVHDLDGAAGSQAQDDLRDLVENANIGMHWVDAEGRILWANRHELELLGYAPHEYIGHNIAEFHVQPERLASILAALVAGERVERQMVGMRRKDGSVVHLSVSSSARTVGGRFAHTRCFSTDVTQRVRDEEARARAQDALALRERQQAALAGLGARALEAATLADVLADGARTIAAGLEHEFAAVLRAVDGGAATELLAQVGWGDAFLGQRTPAPPATQVGYTLRHAEPIVVADVASDGRFTGHAALRENGIRSGLSVIVPGEDGKPWGVLTSHSRHPIPYSLDHQHFLVSVASILAAAIRREAADTRLRTANKRLERVAEVNRRLSEVGTRMAASLQVDTITQLVTDEATQLAEAAFGAFFFNVEDGQGGQYMLYTLSGVPKQAFEGFAQPRNTRIFAPTFEGRGTVRLADVTASPEFGHNAPYHGLPKGHLPVRSYLAVPVKDRAGKVLGGLFLGHPEPGRFDEIHEHALEAMAGMAAVAMENARLYEAAQRSERAAHRASEQAQDADRRKDEFLAMLGHELRNPLAPIQSALDTLAAPGGETARALPILRRQVQHLGRLVDDLLDISRITRGKVDLDVGRVELREAVARAVDMAQPLVDARRHRLECDVPEGLHVAGDFSRLAQVFGNLLMNAAKYTQPGGHLRLRAHETDGLVQVDVEDDGVGIEPALLPRLFQAFAQGPQASDRAHGGLGLGLAIVANLVALHGGTVTAHSDGPGRGARFTVRLPVAAPGASHPAPAAPVAPATAILVVDDNRDAVEALVLALELGGHQAHGAADAHEALALARSLRPQVALLDLGLPGMDGLALARALRAEHGNAMRLVALTGYGTPEDRAHTQAAGFDEHLVKPVSLQRLEETLARVLGAAAVLPA